MAREIAAIRERGANTLNSVRQKTKTERFRGGYDLYLSHLIQSGGFSTTINKEYDDALLRHEKEELLTVKEREALMILKYRKKHMGF